MASRFALSTVVRAGGGVEITAVTASTDRLGTPRDLLWTIERCPEKKRITRSGDETLFAWFGDRFRDARGSHLHISVGAPYGFFRWVAVNLGVVSPAVWIEQLCKQLMELAPDGEIALLLTSDETDRQVVLTHAAAGWEALETNDAVERLRQGKAAVAAQFRRSSEQASERFLRQLSTLPFVSWAENDDDSLVRPWALLVETCVHYFDLSTSRIETHRGRDVIDAWIDRQLEALGTSSTCFLCPDRGSIRSEDRFYRLEIKGSASWLPALFRPEPPGYLLILSADGERALSFRKVPGDDHIYAALHPVKAIVEVREAREAIDELLSTVYPFLRVAHPPLTVQVRPASVFVGEPTLAIPLSSSARRRAAWLRDCLARFRANGIDDRGLREQYGPYYLALGASIAAAWLCAYADHDVEWLIALWEDGKVKQLLVMDGDEKYVLGIRATETRLEAFVADCATLTAAEPTKVTPH